MALPARHWWASSTPAVGTAPANPNASYYLGGISTPTGSSPIWFWNDPYTGNGPSTETITCTVTVTPPSGEGSPMDVSATIHVRVYLPTFVSTCTGGKMAVWQQYLNNPLVQYPDDWWLQALNSTGLATPGMQWTATLSAPSSPPISSWSTNIGSLSLVQIITPEITATDSNGNGWIDNNNGVTGLDTKYLVPWDSALSTGQFYTAGDSPCVDLTDISAVFAQLNDSFQDYLLYTPPSVGSIPVQCVPLGNSSWHTAGSVTIPKSENWVDFTGSAGTVAPPNSHFAIDNTFPSWTHIVGTKIDKIVEQ